MPLAETLRRVPLFADLTPEELTRVGDATRERSYPKNSVIVFEDDPGDALYVVVQGHVKVVLIGEDGREVILSVLGEGDFFGEMALIDDQPRSAHVIAMEDANLLVLRKKSFFPDRIEEILQSFIVGDQPFPVLLVGKRLCSLCIDWFRVHFFYHAVGKSVVISYRARPKKVPHLGSLFCIGIGILPVPDSLEVIGHQHR